MNTGLSIDPIKERHYGRWLVLFLLACVLVASGWYAFQWYSTGWQPPFYIPIASANPAVDESDVSKTQINAHEVESLQPRFISAPDIDIPQTRVFALGLTEQNLLSVPKNIKDAAWYNKSTLPGKGYGVVVISAHGQGIAKDSPFSKMENAQMGDEIIITRGDGQSYKYSVSDKKTIKLEELNTSGINLITKPYDSDKEGLNIMIPAGKWIPKLQQFDERIVVRATAVETKKDTPESE